MMLRRSFAKVEIDMNPLVFIPNGYGRRFAKIKAHPLFDAAFAAVGLKPVALEPMYGIFVGHHYLDGAHTHRHSDVTVGGYAHVRCNIMVKKPWRGGNPVIDGEEVNVEEGDMWVCEASRYFHSSTPIYGGERVILSLGALV